MANKIFTTNINELTRNAMLENSKLYKKADFIDEEEKNEAFIRMMAMECAFNSFMVAHRNEYLAEYRSYYNSFASDYDGENRFLCDVNGNWHFDKKGGE